MKSSLFWGKSYTINLGCYICFKVLVHHIVIYRRCSSPSASNPFHCFLGTLKNDPIQLKLAKIGEVSYRGFIYRIKITSLSFSYMFYCIILLQSFIPFSDWFYVSPHAFYLCEITDVRGKRIRTGMNISECAIKCIFTQYKLYSE